MRRTLAEIREAGYVVSDEDVVPGVASLGAPLRDHDGEVVAAISIAGPRPTILDTPGARASSCSTRAPACPGRSAGADDDDAASR